MRMRDIHCHILPGLDDGSENMDQSLRMLTEAYERGVRSIIATPHFSPQFAEHSPDRIKQLCRELENHARNRFGCRFFVLPGNEIFYSADVPQKLQEGKILTLAETRYTLLNSLLKFPGERYNGWFGRWRWPDTGRSLPCRTLPVPEKVRKTGGTAAAGAHTFRSTGTHWRESV